MKKQIGLFFGVLLTASLVFGAAGVGIYSWIALTGDIADDDLLGITDTSNTTQSDNGSSSKITFSQLLTYLKNTFYDETEVDNALTLKANSADLGTASILDADTTGWALSKVLKFDASGNLVVGDDNEGIGSIQGTDGQVIEFVDTTPTAVDQEYVSFSPTFFAETGTGTEIDPYVITPLANKTEVTATSTLTASSLIMGLITNYGMAAGGDTTLPAVSGFARATVMVEATAQAWSMKPPVGEAFVLDGLLLGVNDEIDIGQTIGNSCVVLRVRTGTSTYQWYVYTVDGVHANGGQS